MEIDTCDTYQKLYYSMGFEMVSEESHNVYEEKGCPVVLDETITTGSTIVTIKQPDLSYSTHVFMYFEYST